MKKKSESRYESPQILCPFYLCDTGPARMRCECTVLKGIASADYIFRTAILKRSWQRRHCEINDWTSCPMAAAELKRQS